MPPKNAPLHFLYPTSDSGHFRLVSLLSWSEHDLYLEGSEEGLKALFRKDLITYVLGSEQHPAKPFIPRFVRPNQASAIVKAWFGKSCFEQKDKALFDLLLSKLSPLGLTVYHHKNKPKNPPLQGGVFVMKTQAIGLHYYVCTRPDLKISRANKLKAQGIVPILLDDFMAFIATGDMPLVDYAWLNERVLLSDFSFDESGSVRGWHFKVKPCFLSALSIFRGTIETDDLDAADEDSGTVKESQLAYFSFDVPDYRFELGDVLHSHDGMTTLQVEQAQPGYRGGLFFAHYRGNELKNRFWCRQYQFAAALKSGDFSMFKRIE